MLRRSVSALLLSMVVLPSAAAIAQDDVVSDEQSAAYGNEGTPPTRKPGFLKRTWSSWCRDFKRSNAWPDPFVAADRVSVRLPFDVCVANGWRFQNTLTEAHFVDNHSQLTEAGALKVAAIINDSPLPYRAIFVLRDSDPEVTAGRIVSIQEAVAKILGDRAPVPIYETYDKPRGAAANYIDEVTRRYQATMPDPRLPGDDDDSGSGYSTGTSGSGTGSLK